MHENGLPVPPAPVRLWRRLTGVPDRVKDPESRRQLQLLAGLLVVLIPLVLVSIIAELLLFPGFRTTFVTIASATAMLLVAYGLARQGQYTAGALLTIAVVMAGCFAVVVLNPRDAFNYAFLFLGMFLGRLLFGAPGVWMTTAINLLGAIVVLPWIGVPPPGNDPLVVPIFLVITAALLQVAIQYRDALERDRRNVLEKRERDFRAILENLQDTYYRVGMDGRIERASPSAGQLLGYNPEELTGMSLADFYVDPDGRAQFLETLKAHGGAVQNYEAALRRRDGSTVWVSTNAHYLRDADGRITGIEGTTRDITERKRIEENLLEIARGVAAATGNTFFQTLVAGIGQTLQADYVFVGELIPGRSDRIRTVAVQAGERAMDDFEYDLRGTPCENVVGRETCAYPEGVQSQFPDDHMLAEMGVQAYVGTPLFGSHGEPLGLLTALYRHPIVQDQTHRSTLEIFAVRAASELERRRAEKALRESEARLKAAQRVAHLGSWELDFLSGRLQWSEEIYRIFEIDPGRFGATYEAFLNEIHPDDRDMVRQAYEESVRQRTPYDIVHRLLMTDGRVKFVRERCETRYDEQGQAIRSVGTVQDVTEQRRAERALAQSESNFRTLTENANVGILVNYKGKHVFANPRLLALLGYTPEEIRQTGIEELVHPNEREDVEQRFRDRKAGKPVPSVYETVFVTKAGEPIPVEITATLTTWAGEPAGLAFVHDIRERKQAARALQESEALLAKAEEVAQVGSFSWNLDTNEVQWSRQTYRLFGVDPDAPHQDIWQILDERLHPDDKPRLAAAIEKIRRDGTRTPMELRVRLPGGATRTLWNDGEVLFDDRSRPTRMFGAMQDVTDRKHAEQRLQALLEAVPDLMFRIRADGTYLDCKLSPLVPTLVDPSMFLGRKTEDILPPDVAVASLATIRQALATRTVKIHTYQLTINGELRDYEARIAPCGPDEVLGMVRDITESRHAEAQMRKLSSAVEQTADSVIITDRHGIIEYANPAFERSTGYSRAEAIGQTPRIVKSGKQTQAFYEHLWSTILAGEVFSDVLINRRKDGTLYYEEKTITPLKDASGVITHFISTGKDVTERMQTQERLQYMAQHDALTELPNRLLLLDRLKQSLARARWHERLVAVLFIDLDRFKTINDSLGHEAGDRMLQLLAERFASAVREGDTVARFGGDEFVILLDDVASDKDVGMVAQKVLDALAAPFLVLDQNLYITASIGVSLFPGDGEDSGTLLKHADVAMYRAKELGKNTYQFYSSDMSARAFERLSLETRLRHALDRNEFVLHYQPQVDADSGRVVGVEALIRWQHPDFGLVVPSDFVPLLEETGLIVAAGEWVLQAACAQLGRWQRQGWRTLRMAVNLSPRQFQGTSLRQVVYTALGELDVARDVLELEITESLLLKQADSTLETLDAFRELGVRIAIDDFGTGYSSLSYLRRLPIDTLKIDRSFVHDIPHDPDDSAITSAIAALATSLKLEMIAEGVETGPQRDFLRALGCRVMQGHLFSRPLTADDMSALLTTRNPLA